jgi:hypothetical protein
MNWTGKKFPKKTPTNFIEALKDLGSSVVNATRQESTGVGKGILEHLGGLDSFHSQGELQPNQPIDFDTLQKKEKELRLKEIRVQEEVVSLRKQEKILYSRQEKEIQLQIKAIQEELKKLARSTEGLAKEVKVATIQAPVDPGTYHISFFARLKSFIFEFRKRIQDSQTWLSTLNQKSQKRCHYWFAVKKSGTKFMLSQERYMATQAG